ncbi:AI-2E family transporter [Brachybacterium sp. AOP25-B2-12]|uniref:AI-2E family transporter n=1 Tax=Brachybacterium sp. AOP25-B2-12 TaxID=3457710 RepID=UPI0040345C81
MDLLRPTARRPERPGPHAESALPPEVREIPVGVRRAAAWSWRLIVVVVAAAGILWALGQVMSLLVPVLVAILLAALLSPLVGILARHTPLGRGLASLVVLLGTILVVAGMITVAGQQFTAQFSSIQSKAVSGFEQLVSYATSTLRLDPSMLERAQTELLQRLQANSETIARGALTGVETIGTTLTGLVICLFALFFLLKDGAAIWRWVVGLLPPAARIPTHEAFRRGWKALSAYVRTQIVVAAINGTGIGIGVAALGLGSYAVPVFLLVFLFSFIPLIGAIVSGAIAVLLVLVLKSWVFALVMVGIVLAVHFIEADVLHPFMMGRAVSLHPLGVILGVALGAETAGIAGALFAIPLIAFLNATLLQLVGRDPSPELGHDSRTASMLVSGARRLAGARPIAGVRRLARARRAGRTHPGA